MPYSTIVWRWRRCSYFLKMNLACFLHSVKIKKQDRRTDARSLAQLLLGDLGLRRNAAEYKRLIYVAATRARETIAFSGLMLQTTGAQERQAPPKCYAQARPSAIAWFDSMDREGVFDGLPVQVLKNPQLAKTVTPVIAPPKLPPAPAQFEPERIETPQPELEKLFSPADLSAKPRLAGDYSAL